MRKTVIAVLAALLLAACGGGSESDRTPAEVEAQRSADVAEALGETQDANAVDPDAVIASFEANAGMPIGEMGDLTTWHPYYDSVESLNSEGIIVHLSTPGDFSDAEVKALAKEAALHIFNFAGPEHENLMTIVVYVNGVDKGTLRRDEVPLLNR